MTASELAAFKANTPMKYPIKQYKNILEEMADNDPSVAAVVGKAIAVVVRSPRRGEPRAGRATRYFGTRARATHGCASAKKETSIYVRCWCRERTTFWNHFGEDSDLRRWGRKLSARGGKIAKKRAVVAVARKLAVLLHRLWVSGKVYEPLDSGQKAMNAAA